MKITNFTLVEIGREKGASAIQTSGLSDEVMKTLLIDALPLGNPENKVFKIISIEQNLYLSSLLLDDKKDYGLALIIKLDQELQKFNPIGLLDGMNTILREAMKAESKILPKELDLDYNENDSFVGEIENFDLFIFSVFTQQKTLIIGEQDDIKNFLADFYNFIPNELKRHITLIANSSNLTNKVFLHALPVSDDILKIIDGKKGEYTILFLPMKTAYGSFTSPFSKKIANLFFERKKESAKEEIMHIFQLAIESKEIIPTADFAAEKHVTLADASLILWIRANHYDLEVQKSILEQME